MLTSEIPLDEYKNKNEIIIAMDAMQLAAETVTRSIEIITTDVETKLKKYLEKCVYLVLQLYESTDASDTSQLAIIVKMFFDNFLQRKNSSRFCL